MGRSSKYCIGVIFAFASFGVAVSSHAADGPIIPSAPQIAANSYILMDADTQRILAQGNENEPLHPASLTKIMTSYVAAEELQAGRINLADEVPISVKAWRTPGSRMFIREGTIVVLEDLLKGIIIQSGNDASVAVAEHIAGSEEAFAEMMNRTADQLGMRQSTFRNATGLPNDEHHTTAADLAILTRALIRRHPERYATYSERSYKFNDIEQPNRNRLLWRDRTVDGVKTGHTSAAGYCLVASALRDNMRLISVVMGTENDEVRMRESQKLLSYGFRYFETQRLYDANVSLKNSQVWYGESETIDLGLAEEVFVTIPRGHYSDLSAELEVPRIVEAPFAQYEELGRLRLMLFDEVVYEAPLIALAAVEEAGLFSRMGDSIYLLFGEIFGGD
jgi:D-alanyl-D-alanine carboxypeptidase (penicillin-binding protein 5/6)